MTTPHAAAKQREILCCIASARLATGYGPTIREIRERVGGAYGVIYKHLGELTRQGLIRRDIATWRAVSVTEEGKAVLMRELDGK